MSSLPQHLTMSPGQAYFDVDGDKELRSSSTEDSDSLLTWRGDPVETGSDCTIVVVTNELQAVTYHVHKSIVCFGTRQSKYFANILLQTRSSASKDEAKKITSIKVELDQRDAENVPIFLDFMYRPSSQQQSGLRNQSAQLKSSALSNGTMETAASTFSSPSVVSGPTAEDNACTLVEGDDICTENAVSLRHLARTFENEALTRAANKFIQKDLNFKTGPLYLYKAWEYKDDRLMESAQRLCAENIEQVDTKALIRLPLNLFRVVIKSLESFEEENKELSILLSEVVCRYMEKHPKSRTAELLLELTDPLLMPYIASEAAIGYTAIVKDLEPDDAARHWSSLVRLCRRCAKAVVKEYGWSDFSVNAAVNEYLVNSRHNKNSSSSSSSKPTAPTRVDSLLFATSFAAALEQAQDDYEDISSTHEELESMVSILHKSVTSLEVAHQRKDEYIEKQQSAIESAKKEITLLKRQIDEIKRKQPLPPPQRRCSPPMLTHQRMQQSGENSVSFTQASTVAHSNADERRRHQYVSPPPQQHSRIPHSSEEYVSFGQASPALHSSNNVDERQRQYAPPPLSQQPPRQFTSSPAPMARQRMQQQQQLPFDEMARQRLHYQQQQQQQQPFDELARQHMQPQLQQPFDEQQPDLLEMNVSPPKDLISPAQVGMDVHANKNRKRQELKTKSEMRSKSLLV